MTQFYSMAVDIITVFILLFMIYRAYKMGFLRSIVLLVGYVASIIVALYLSRFLSKMIFDNLLRDQIIKSIDSTISSVADIESVATVLPTILASIPAFISNAIVSSFGGNEAIIAMLEEKTGGIIANISVAITDFVVQPIVYVLLQTLLCLIIFIICVIIVKTIAKIFKGFYVIPILGPINSLLGGILGAVQSIVFLLLLGIIAEAVVALTAGSLSFLNDSILSSTYIFKYFYLKL